MSDLMRLLALVALVASLVACKAGDGEVCAKDVDCASGLRCSLAEFKCFSPIKVAHALKEEECKESSGCEYDGLCAAKGKECIAVTCPSDGEACATWGKCTLKGEACVATSDEDCKGSKRCTEGGSCTAKEGECKATSEEDCKRSKRCKDKGECSLRLGRGCWDPN